jgi:hypothetical protein
MRSESTSQRKIKMTPSEIELATTRHVTQNLNQLARLSASLLSEGESTVDTKCAWKICQSKTSMTPSGIEPATVRLVALSQPPAHLIHPFNPVTPNIHDNTSP